MLIYLDVLKTLSKKEISFLRNTFTCMWSSFDFIKEI